MKDQRELRSRADPGCRFGAQVALQRCLIPDRLTRTVSNMRSIVLV
jgi:hypothetical protein